MVFRAEFLNGVLSQFQSPRYLEIGVNEGQTFFEISAAYKAAVDPSFIFDVSKARESGADSEFFEITSDEYFATVADRAKLFDVIYLDGLHTFEQTLRDFNNSIELLQQDGVIVIDDVLPTSYQAGLPNQLDSFKINEFLNDDDASWMGDTYKLVFFIEAYFPFYDLRTIADNHGQAVVWRAKRPREQIAKFDSEQLSRLQYVDIVRNINIFRLTHSSDIYQELASQKVR